MFANQQLINVGAIDGGGYHTRSCTSSGTTTTEQVDIVCVGDTQVLTGQWVSAAYVAAVVSRGTGHSSIVTGKLAITVDSAVAVSWANNGRGLTRVLCVTVHSAVVVS